MSSTSFRPISRALRLGLGVLCGLVSFAGLLLLLHLTGPPGPVRALGTTLRYVASFPAGDDDANDCTRRSMPCLTIQHAVDVAGDGDEIRVATGRYTDLHARNDPGIGSVVVEVEVAPELAGTHGAQWNSQFLGELVAGCFEGPGYYLIGARVGPGVIGPEGGVDPT